MTVIRRAETRRTETPNAVMTTYASPDLGGSTQALWQVEMSPGARGPHHAMDGQQVWTVLRGAAIVETGDAAHELVAGDSIVLDGGVTRRVHAGPAEGFTAVVTGRGADRATVPGSEAVVPPWIA